MDRGLIMRRGSKEGSAVDRWRILQDGACEGAENMAVDEAIFRAACCGFAPPTLRLYEWKLPTLSIGYQQKAEPFESWDGPMVRRITGGRAVLHHMELTYSIVCGSKNRLFRSGIQGAYSTISKCIARALGDFGVKATFSPIRRDRGKSDFCFHTPSRYEILVGGRKIVGSAQRRFKDGFLQHGSILLGVDESLIRRIFGEEALERMSWVGALGHIEKEEFKRALTERLGDGLKAQFEHGVLRSQEACLKEDLITKRYGTKEWNHGNGEYRLPLEYERSADMAQYR
jgi:lipoate-protein ligase A